eukprot:5222386-Pleurochrysis_carterae.AAC.1
MTKAPAIYGIPLTRLRLRLRLRLSIAEHNKVNDRFRAIHHTLELSERNPYTTRCTTRYVWSLPAASRKLYMLHAATILDSNAKAKLFPPHYGTIIRIPSLAGKYVPDTIWIHFRTVFEFGLDTLVTYNYRLRKWRVRVAAKVQTVPRSLDIAITRRKRVSTTFERATARSRVVESKAPMHQIERT